MSVVIVGGNECMIRQYKDLCREYKCKAKVYPKMTNSLKDLGFPDLLVLFTNTVSHKMIRYALSEVKGQGTRIARSHTSSCRLSRPFLRSTPRENNADTKIDRKEEYYVRRNACKALFTHSCRNENG